MRIFTLHILDLKARHRGDILEFSIHAKQNLAVQEAIFNLHVHGLDWITEALRNSADGPASQSLQSIVDGLSSAIPSRDHLAISLNRLVRQRYTRTDSDYVGAIPKGQGRTIRFNVTDMVLDWLRHGNSSQEMVIKTQEPWMRTLLSLATNTPTVRMGRGVFF